MSPGRLDAIRREIGLIMGWKAPSYTARRFADDLNQLHPGLVSIAADGHPYRLKRVLAGRRQPPPYWDKVVDELLAAKLTADGVPTKQGGQWHHSTIAKVVARREYYETILGQF